MAQSLPGELPTKKCWDCGQEKALSEFGSNRSKKGGREGQCKVCRRPYQSAQARQRYNTAEKRRTKNLRGHYQIEPAMYEAYFASQRGVCAICACAETKKDPRTQQIRHLSVDHDHQTGQIRGLLCRDCNIAFGLLSENPDRIRALLAYAEKHSQSEGMHKDGKQILPD